MSEAAAVSASFTVQGKDYAELNEAAVAEAEALFGKGEWYAVSMKIEPREAVTREGVGGRHRLGWQAEVEVAPLQDAGAGR